MSFLLFIVCWFILIYISLSLFLYDVMIVIVDLIEIIISLDTCNIKKENIMNVIESSRVES